MKVLVTGATGFTGTATVPCLIEQGIAVRCMVRSSSNRSSLPDSQIEWVVGDVEDYSSLVGALQGVDALINIVSLGFGHAPHIVRAVVESGVRRAIFISTTAIFTPLAAPSKAVRIQAEELITGSGLDYTILRPTMIYGNSRDRNMCRLIRYLQKVPIIPIFGSGKYLQQPVYVDDIAQGIVKALSSNAAVGQAYNLSGAAPLTYDEVIQTIAQLLHRRVIKVHIPASPVIAALQILKRSGFKLPVSAEQIQRLNEDKAFDWEAAHRDIGYMPRSFQEGIVLELREMGLYD